MAVIVAVLLCILLQGTKSCIFCNREYTFDVLCIIVSGIMDCNFAQLFEINSIIFFRGSDTIRNRVDGSMNLVMNLGITGI